MGTVSQFPQAAASEAQQEYYALTRSLGALAVIVASMSDQNTLFQVSFLERQLQHFHLAEPIQTSLQTQPRRILRVGDVGREEKIEPMDVVAVALEAVEASRCGSANGGTFTGAASAARVAMRSDAPQSAGHAGTFAPQGQTRGAP